MREQTEKKKKMKWGRKRYSSSHSSTHTSPSSSIIDRVFPVSWLSKLKQKGGNNITEATVSLDQMKRRDHHRKLDFPIPNDSLKHGRFYSSDADDYNDGGEAYWRVSFGEERIIEGRRSTGGINPLWYNDELHVPVLGFKSSNSSGIQENMIVSDRGEYPNFNDMVLDVKKMKEKKNREMSNGKSRCDLSLRKLNVQEKQGNFVRRLDFEEDELLKPVERDVSRAVLSPVHDLRKQNKMSYPNFVLSPVQEDISLEATEENRIIANSLEKLSISEWPRFEEDNMKFKEIKVRTETKKKPPRFNARDHYYSRKPKQNNNKVKAYSPRTECKIRALEEMRKARIKSKRKEKKEDVIIEKNVFDSFAVVKSSYNPPKDFRDSMVEMIKEKDIKRPEELEQLLASYLTLNSDEYHDVIIEVFRLVWLEMKDAAYRDSQICNCRYCDY